MRKKIKELNEKFEKLYSAYLNIYSNDNELTGQVESKWCKNILINHTMEQEYFIRIVTIEPMFAGEIRTIIQVNKEVWDKISLGKLTTFNTKNPCIKNISKKFWTTFD